MKVFTAVHHGHLYKDDAQTFAKLKVQRLCLGVPTCFVHNSGVGGEWIIKLPRKLTHKAEVPEYLVLNTVQKTLRNIAESKNLLK